MSYAKIVVLGNVTRDIELRYTPKGTAVCDIDVAVNRKWTTAAGENKEEVCFLTFTAFDRRAEVAGQYLSKGSQVFLEGYPKQESWEDKTSGQKRSKLKFMLTEMQFCGNRNGGAGSQSSSGEEDQTKGGVGQRRPAPASRPAAPPPASEEAPPPDDGSNIPF